MNHAYHPYRRLRDQVHAAHLFADCSSQGISLRPFSGFCWCVPVDWCGMWEATLLILVRVSLFLQDCHNTSMYQSLADCP